jgi:cobalt-zinc-cadmium efflux system outer membrane protein
MKRLCLALAAAAALTACAPAVRYHPKPIVPAATAERLESRTLNNPGLRQFMKENLGHEITAWPLQVWGLKDLMLAAYYYNPQMQIARAQAEAARAAIITAAARPNPTVTLAPGIPSPYLLGLNLLFTREAAGRRRIRVEQARDLSTAARYALASTAWKVRSGLRTACLNYFIALRQAELLTTETRLHSQQVQLLSERFKVGYVARTNVVGARQSLLSIRVVLQRAEGRIPETRAVLAGAIGIPVSALQGIRFSWAAFDHQPQPAALSPQRIRREAVLNRLDVRQALAQYQAAQAALRLQIARQHPNFSLGPGYQFEESHNYFTLTFSSILPVFNRNQGPIAEAEAQRKQAAAQFLATQANAISQSEQALARYDAARAELQEARRSLAQVRNLQEPMAVQQVKFGQSDQLFLNSIRLQGAAAVSAQLAALDHLQAALGQLEDAVQRPLEPGGTPPLSPQSKALKQPGKEVKP